jgi:hypothetical protein
MSRIFVIVIVIYHSHKPVDLVAETYKVSCEVRTNLQSLAEF